ncbi:MAG: 5'-3' exonuclease H3TH domain-containing protein [Actinomycetota bacterium]|nr:5'-3' exonuclease H3TH domain-containing protein [Actinomycetota bacterium]
MRVHLIDGTYELFRQHFGQVSRHGDAGPFDAAVGVVSSTLQLVASGATHVTVASDHVIESFRNDLYAGYKSSEGMDPVLLHQIPIMEEALVACGFTTWAMVEWEADDALAAAAAVADADPRVSQVLIVTPDKDLGQCVKGTRVVQFDRRKDEIVDEAAVTEKFGVPPSSIADYLALVGDSADGYPGLPGWGAKSASTVLAKFGSIEAIPASSGDWGLPALRGAEKLARTLHDQLADALLFKVIATTALDVPVGTVDEWEWRGPTPALATVAARLGAPDLAERADRMWQRVLARN